MARELAGWPGSPPSAQVVLLSIMGEAGSYDPTLASPITLPGTNPPSLQSHQARKGVLFLLER